MTYSRGTGVPSALAFSPRLPQTTTHSLRQGAFAGLVLRFQTLIPKRLGSARKGTNGRSPIQLYRAVQYVLASCQRHLLTITRWPKSVASAGLDLKSRTHVPRLPGNVSRDTNGRSHTHPYKAVPSVLALRP